MLLQQLGAHSVAFPDDPEQNVLGADVIVVQLQRLAERELERFLRPRGERDMPAGLCLPGPDDRDRLPPRAFQGHAEAVERAERDATGLTEQPEQDVLSADVVVMKLPRFFLSEHDNVPGPAGESLEHGPKPDAVR